MARSGTARVFLLCLSRKVNRASTASVLPRLITKITPVTSIPIPIPSRNPRVTIVTNTTTDDQVVAEHEFPKTPDQPLVQHLQSQEKKDAADQRNGKKGQEHITNQQD